jgi:undecaprenyl-diphosphatase
MKGADDPERETEASTVSPQRRRVRVVMNARAGRTKAATAGQILECFEAVGVGADPVAGDPGLERVLDDAAAAEPVLLGVAGGDGTVRSAAQRLTGGQTALLAVPTGTLNHFSRSIGIQSVEDAARAVAAGRSARIAVGAVNDVVFLNTATFGLYADVLRRRERLRRWIGKWPAALAAFLATIARYRPVHVVLELDGQRLSRETALVRVALGRRTFPVANAPLEERRAPELEIAILRAHTRGGLLALGFRTFLVAIGLRQQSDDDAVELLHARAFLLQSARSRIGVTLDGEIMRIPGALHVAVRDEALTVVVGENEDRGATAGR